MPCWSVLAVWRAPPPVGVADCSDRYGVGVRTAFRVAVVTAGTSLLTLAASPAFAAHPDDGSQPGKGFSVLQTLFWFVAWSLSTLPVRSTSTTREPPWLETSVLPLGSRSAW